MEADIRHDCGNHRIIRQRSLLHHILGAHDKDMVTIDNLALLIDAEGTVGITVMSNTKVRAIFQDRLL